MPLIKRLLVILLLLGSIAFVYYPLANKPFTSLDIDEYITGNQHVRAGLSRGGFYWAFASFGHAANWHPLTWLSHMLDVQLFGLNPRGHNLMNLTLHTANSILLFVMLCSITPFLWRNALVALLFALHPLHVESVAWEVERKDVLSALFMILTIMAYAGYIKKPNLRRYLLVLAGFALGLLAKPMLVTLPFVLLLMDYWPLGRFGLHKGKGGFCRARPLWIFLEKFPLICLSTVSGAITLLAQKKGGAVLESVGFTARLGNAGVSYARYLFKTAWPVDLAVFYPYVMWKPWQALAAWSFIAVISASVVLGVKKYPYFFVGWSWFLGTLIPVIGLVQVGSQAMADRYTYVPLMGIFIVASWCLAIFTDGLAKGKIYIWEVVIFMLTTLTVLTRGQVGYWKDDETLFRHAVIAAEKNWMMRTHLGLALSRKGRKEDAVIQYIEALQVKPDSALAHNSLGVALFESGKVEEAIYHYLQALRSKPNYSQAHNNMGNALMATGKFHDALGHFKQVLKAAADRDFVNFNYANALAALGILDEAVVYYQKALDLNPSMAEANLNLGAVYLRQDRPDQALDMFIRTLRLQPDNADAHFNAGLVLEKTGNKEEAVRHYGLALKADQGHAKARARLENLTR